MGDVGEEKLSTTIESPGVVGQEISRLPLGIVRVQASTEQRPWVVGTNL